MVSHPLADYDCTYTSPSLAFSLTLVAPQKPSGRAQLLPKPSTDSNPVEGGVGGESMHREGGTHPPPVVVPQGYSALRDHACSTWGHDGRPTGVGKKQHHHHPSGSPHLPTAIVVYIGFRGLSETTRLFVSALLHTKLTFERQNRSP